jgi:hypothetical protein
VFQNAVLQYVYTVTRLLTALKRLHAEGVKTSSSDTVINKAYIVKNLIHTTTNNRSKWIKHTKRRTNEDGQNKAVITNERQSRSGTVLIRLAVLF